MRRNTNHREAILKVLINTRSHPTADDIYDEVREKIPNISKGTVYRNLKVLQEMGRVRELNLDGTKSRFEVAIASHYHFRCENCSRVLDLDVPIHTELDREIAKQTGLRISHHQLEFSGLCHDCQSSIGKQTPNKTKRKE
jgi:Fur family peroxide stress response transcriptional regulator